LVIEHCEARLWLVSPQLLVSEGGLVASKRSEDGSETQPFQLPKGLWPKSQFQVGIDQLLKAKMSIVLTPDPHTVKVRVAERRMKTISP
jgi:hypothetical protein